MISVKLKSSQHLSCTHFVRIFALDTQILKPCIKSYKMFPKNIKKTEIQYKDKVKIRVKRHLGTEHAVKDKS